MRRRKYAVVVCSFVGALLLGPALAHAQGTSGATAAAQALFDEGRKLMAEGKFAQACPKLAESQKLDPGIGTLYHLANCYEQNGQIASAWAAFVEVASNAKLAGQAERAKVAHDRVAALEPKLSRLKIDVAQPDAAAGLEIKRDGLVVGRGSWGVAIPVDPGSHTISATAPGKKEWQTSVVIKADASVASTTVPALEEEPKAAEGAAPVATATPAPTDNRDQVRVERPITAPIVLVGGATIALGAATAVTGIIALQKRSAFNDVNGTPGHSQQELQDKRDSAALFSTVSTALAGATVVGAVVTTVLFVTRPSRRTSVGASTSAWIGRGSGGITVGGAL